MFRKDGIDNMALEQVMKEKIYRRAVLISVFVVVQYLADNNGAFSRKTEKHYQPNNVNFLGLIEMLAKYGPIMQEHVPSIKDGATHYHYLGHQFLNKLIELMASEVKEIIIDKLKLAKYSSIILYCTPHVIYIEQMSLIVRSVDVSHCDIKLVEYFIEFFIVEDTTGRVLSDLLLAAIEKFGLNIDDCRGQGYDNGKAESSANTHCP
jgi:hypothetical protein